MIINNFSNIFEKQVKIELGLELIIEVESPALCIGTTLASFNSLGKIPPIKERFIICVRGLTKQSMHCFRINAGILSHFGKINTHWKKN